MPYLYIGLYQTGCKLALKCQIVNDMQFRRLQSCSGIGLLIETVKLIILEVDQNVVSVSHVLFTGNIGLIVIFKHSKHLDLSQEAQLLL